ncbi:hypothetical protein PIB30_069885, partial [Stylosanthes scabra]|nr:hypothetical protein [Stylosanthes scabra]
MVLIPLLGPEDTTAPFGSMLKIRGDDTCPSSGVEEGSLTSLIGSTRLLKRLFVVIKSLADDEGLADDIRIRSVTTAKAARRWHPRWRFD